MYVYRICPFKKLLLSTDRFHGTPTKSQNPTNLGQAGPTTSVRQKLPSTTQCYSYKGTTKVYKPCPAGWLENE